MPLVLWVEVGCEFMEDALELVVEAQPGEGLELVPELGWSSDSDLEPDLVWLRSNSCSC